MATPPSIHAGLQTIATLNSRRQYDMAWRISEEPLICHSCGCRAKVVQINAMSAGGACLCKECMMNLANLV